MTSTSSSLETNSSDFLSDLIQLHELSESMNPLELGSFLISHPDLDINLPLPLNLSNMSDKKLAEGWSPLHRAAYLGDCKSVKELMKAGANTNTISLSQETALHFASRKGHSSVVEQLVNGSRATIIDTKNSVGETPLLTAVLSGHEPIIKFLFICGASVDAADAVGWTVIHHAVREVSPEIFSLLLSQSEASVNLQTRPTSLDELGGYTPLHLSALEGRSAITERLLRLSKIQVNARDGSGKTPIELAAAYNNEKDMILLAQHFETSVAHIFPNQWVDVVLHTAGHRQNIDVIRRLLESPAAAAAVSSSSSSSSSSSAIGRSTVYKEIHVAPKLSAEVIEFTLTQVALPPLAFQVPITMISETFWRSTSILHYLCRHGHGVLLGYLLDQHKDLDWTRLDGYDRKPIHRFLKLGLFLDPENCVHLIPALLSKSEMTIDDPSFKNLILWQPHGVVNHTTGESLLHYLVKAEAKTFVHELLEAVPGVLVSVVDLDGKSPIDIAEGKKMYQLANWLRSQKSALAPQTDMNTVGAKSRFNARLVLALQLSALAFLFVSLSSASGTASSANNLRLFEILSYLVLGQLHLLPWQPGQPLIWLGITLPQTSPLGFVPSLTFVWAAATFLTLLFVLTTIVQPAFYSIEHTDLLKLQKLLEIDAIPAESSSSALVSTLRSTLVLGLILAVCAYTPAWVFALMFVAYASFVQLPAYWSWMNEVVEKSFPRWSSSMTSSQLKKRKLRLGFQLLGCWLGQRLPLIGVIPFLATQASIILSCGFGACFAATSLASSMAAVQLLTSAVLTPFALYSVLRLSFVGERFYRLSFVRPASVVRSETTEALAADSPESNLARADRIAAASRTSTLTASAARHAKASLAHSSSIDSLASMSSYSSTSRLTISSNNPQVVSSPRSGLMKDTAPASPASSTTTTTISGEDTIIVIPPSPSTTVIEIPSHLSPPSPDAGVSRKKKERTALEIAAGKPTKPEKLSLFNWSYDTPPVLLSDLKSPFEGKSSSSGLRKHVIIHITALALQLIFPLTVLAFRAQLLSYVTTGVVQALTILTMMLSSILHLAIINRESFYERASTGTAISLLTLSTVLTHVYVLYSLFLGLVSPIVGTVALLVFAGLWCVNVGAATLIFYGEEKKSIPVSMIPSTVISLRQVSENTDELMRQQALFQINDPKEIFRSKKSIRLGSALDNPIAVPIVDPLAMDAQLKVPEVPQPAPSLAQHSSHSVQELNPYKHRPRRASALPQRPAHPPPSRLTRSASVSTGMNAIAAAASVSQPQRPPLVSSQTVGRNRATNRPRVLPAVLQIHEANQASSASSTSSSMIPDTPNSARSRSKSQPPKMTRSLTLSQLHSAKEAQMKDEEAEDPAYEAKQRALRRKSMQMSLPSQAIGQRIAAKINQGIEEEDDEELDDWSAFVLSKTGSIKSSSMTRTRSVSNPIRPSLPSMMMNQAANKNHSQSSLLSRRKATSSTKRKAEKERKRTRTVPAKAKGKGTKAPRSNSTTVGAGPPPKAPSLKTAAKASKGKINTALQETTKTNTPRGSKSQSKEQTRTTAIIDPENTAPTTAI